MFLLVLLLVVVVVMVMVLVVRPVGAMAMSVARSVRGGEMVARKGILGCEDGAMSVVRSARWEGGTARKGSILGCGGGHRDRDDYANLSSMDERDFASNNARVETGSSSLGSNTTSSSSPTSATVTLT